MNTNLVGVTKVPNNVPLSAQLRMIVVIELLAGHEIIGLPLKEITDLMASSVAQSTVWRDLKTLESVGWAQQVDGRWMLAARPLQILHRFYKGLETIQRRAAEVAANYANTQT